ncbi:hypothetical protein [[Phormidium] sp. ETS-05]|uniref:hypothetical protein n=1 Tax=[Phormidium] sp. ETS-05 TaxID=222819 RepID=UPI0018EF0BC3|nr:hypothetical protein [[Phormidium] sp. ETS-05]
MLFIIAITSVITTLVCFLASKTDSVELNRGKIIEMGWGTPTPIYIRDHIQEMQQIPLDGIVIGFADNENRNIFGNSLWGAKTVNIDDYSQSVEAIKNTQFGRFTENFLRFNVMPGEIDWHDENFKSVIKNARLAAQVAKSGGLKGVLLDVEHYQGKPFCYLSQPERLEHSFREYQQKVRQRGRQFIRAINEAYPDIKILLTFGYHIAYVERKSLQQANYGLLPSFLNGILEGSLANTLIFDGWEFSYGYKTEEQFQEAYETIHQKGLERTNVKEDFIDHYRASFGLWIDVGQVWQPNNYSENYFTPEQFEDSLRFALNHTDGYVWIYSQKARWWDGKMPKPYIDALTKAKHP